MSVLGKVLPIPCTLEGDFFYQWMNYLTPVHGLTKAQAKMVAEFLKERYNLGKSIINDDELLDRILMSPDTKKKIRARLGLKESHFQVIWGALKQKGVIINNKLNRSYIPNTNGKDFKVVLYFKFTDVEQGDSSEDSN